MMEGQEGISHHALGQHPWALSPTHSTLSWGSLRAWWSLPRARAVPRGWPQSPGGGHALGHSVTVPSSQEQDLFLSPQPPPPSTPCLSQHDPRRVPRGTGGVQAGFGFCQLGGINPEGGSASGVWHRAPKSLFFPQMGGWQQPGAEWWPRGAGNTRIGTFGVPSLLHPIEWDCGDLGTVSLSPRCPPGILQDREFPE